MVVVVVVVVVPVLRTTLPKPCPCRKRVRGKIGHRARGRWMRTATERRRPGRDRDLARREKHNNNRTAPTYFNGISFVRVTIEKYYSPKPCKMDDNTNTCHRVHGGRGRENSDCSDICTCLVLSPGLPPVHGPTTSHAGLTIGRWPLSLNHRPERLARFTLKYGGQCG